MSSSSSTARISPIKLSTNRSKVAPTSSSGQPKKMMMSQQGGLMMKAPSMIMMKKAAAGTQALRDTSSKGVSFQNAYIRGKSKCTYAVS